jgi:hypothetical protein
LPEIDLAEDLIAAKTTTKKNLANYLSQYLPVRLIDGLLTAHAFDGNLKSRICRISVCVCWPKKSIAGS